MDSVIIPSGLTIVNRMAFLIRFTIFKPDGIITLSIRF